jgi:hypothetical protein
MADKYTDEIPEGLKYKVERWNEPFDFTNPSHLTSPVVSGYVLKILLRYRKGIFKGKRMWEYFKEDFKGFTQDTWKKANRQVTREMREILILREVWVKSVKGTSYGKVLQDCLQETAPHAWDDDDIKQERLQLLEKQNPQELPKPQVQEPKEPQRQPQVQ